MSILRKRHSSSVVAAVPAAMHKRFAGETPAATAAFTLIELLVVISIIIVLAGLVLATSAYVAMKGRRSRAEAEIAAMSVALESYKVDNGIYPRTSETDSLNPTSPNPTSYQAASLKLYEFLSGDSNDDRIADTKSYFAFKPNQLNPSDQTPHVAFIRDPFGNSYGYSTARASNPTGTIGYNPTFDLWSVADDTTGNQNKWIKNW
jgi:type II secretory pathway pseudopilin PulG